MKVNELRVGNYYYFNHTEISKKDQVIKIDLKMLFAMSNDHLHYGLEFYSPISLTEEWLLKFGFEKNDSGFGHIVYEKNENTIQIELLQPVAIFRIFIPNFGFTAINYVQYLHQFQNLYFALTGEELKINL
ncbi:MAG: hypothetical protein ACRC8Z_03660 [Empedobacter falsenii]